MNAIKHSNTEQSWSMPSVVIHSPVMASRTQQHIQGYDITPDQVQTGLQILYRLNRMMLFATAGTVQSHLAIREIVDVVKDERFKGYQPHIRGGRKPPHTENYSSRLRGQFAKLLGCQSRESSNLSFSAKGKTDITGVCQAGSIRK